MIDRSMGTDRPLLDSLLGDGRPALATVGVGLAFAGGLAVYLGLTRQLLPHDLAFPGIGTTVTYVASDLEFIGVPAAELDAINPRLISLVAHDRIGFSGGVLVSGLLIAAIGVLGVGRAARQTVFISGVVGFGMAWRSILSSDPQIFCISLRQSRDRSPCSPVWSSGPATICVQTASARVS